MEPVERMMDEDREAWEEMNFTPEERKKLRPWHAFEKKDHRKWQEIEAEAKRKNRENPHDPSLPILFWDDLPEDADESHPDVAAIRALMVDDPEVDAENYKEDGNAALQDAKRKGKFYFRVPIEKYTKAIMCRHPDPKANSVYYSNRAQVHLLLENYAKALKDAREAMSLDEKNVKAAYRAARAALALDRLDEAEATVSYAKTLDPDSTDLDKLQRRVDARRKQLQAVEERARIDAAATRRPLVALVSALQSRGLQVGPYQHRSLGQGRVIRLSEDGKLLFPMLVLYPETQQSDLLEDVPEDALLSDQLDVLYNPEAPPLPWDTSREYTRDKVDFYYQVEGCAAPLSSDALVEAFATGFANTTYNARETRGHTMVRADPDLSLLEVLLREGHVVPGVAVFYAVSRGTSFATRFLEGEWREPMQ